jgi:hypothetical protein
MISLKLCRISFLACAVLVIVIALIVATCVITPVRTDTFPGATPESAVPAFWFNVACNLVAATVFLALAIRAKGRSVLATIVVTSMGLFLLLLAFAFTDAGAAYLSEGPAMHVTSIILFICSVASFIAAVLGITTVFLLPKRQERA